MAPKAVLIGLPGSGKSTIGRRLAKALGVGFLDTDAAIEQRTGRPIAEIFATDGEREFRRIEEEVVRAALTEHDGVLSLGGGAVTSRCARRWPATPSSTWRSAPPRGCGAPAATRCARCWPGRIAPRSTARCWPSDPGAVVRYIVSRLPATDACRAAT